MNTLPTPQVVEVEVFEGGAMITFGNGLCAVFPAELLWASKKLAMIMSEIPCGLETSDAESDPTSTQTE